MRQLPSCIRLPHHKSGCKDFNKFTTMCETTSHAFHRGVIYETALH